MQSKTSTVRARDLVIEDWPQKHKAIFWVYLGDGCRVQCHKRFSDWLNFLQRWVLLVKARGCNLCLSCSAHKVYGFHVKPHLGSRRFFRRYFVCPEPPWSFLRASFPALSGFLPLPRAPFLPSLLPTRPPGGGRFLRTVWCGVKELPAVFGRFLMKASLRSGYSPGCDFCLQTYFSFRMLDPVCPRSSLKMRCRWHAIQLTSTQNHFVLNLLNQRALLTPPPPQDVGGLHGNQTPQSPTHRLRRHFHLLIGFPFLLPQNHSQSQCFWSPSNKLSFRNHLAVRRKMQTFFPPLFAFVLLPSDVPRFWYFSFFNLNPILKYINFFPFAQFAAFPQDFLFFFVPFRLIFFPHTRISFIAMVLTSLSQDFHSTSTITSPTPDHLAGSEASGWTQCCRRRGGEGALGMETRLGASCYFLLGWAPNLDPIKAN